MIRVPTNPINLPASRPIFWLLVAVASVALLAACSSDDEPAPAPTAAPAPTTAPVAAPTSAPAAAPAPASQSAEGSVTVSISDSAVARYRIGEQLARLSVPNDAVGETPDVGGAIVFNSDGSVNSDLSTITVGLAGLTSDESRRDNYVRGTVFNTSQFPDATLVVTAVSGLSWPLPESGEATFQITGDFTVRDLTNPVTWDVTAQFSGGSVTGQAKTVVTFDELELSKPSFAFILSVEDEIRLELDIDATISGS